MNVFQVVDPNLGDRRELWMYGRHVMMGYLNREDATTKVRLS
jgi:long-subunit acyl-CoA synthetase (AMP-forming)